MLWVIGAVTIGYISIYSAFRELTSELTGSGVKRALRCSTAFTFGIGSTTLIIHHAFFDQQSHTLQPIPLLLWLALSLVTCFLLVIRTRFDCDEKEALLNLFSGVVALLVVTLTCSILLANGQSVVQALLSPAFWLFCIFTVVLITFAFYACQLVSKVLQRPAMLNYRYFTRPLMLTFCVALIQIIGAYLYPNLSEFHAFKEGSFIVSREQFLLGIALLSSGIGTVLLFSNFYDRYLGSELKYIQELIHSRPSSHTFWQAFITLLALSLLIMTLLFWFQWRSTLDQQNSVTAVSTHNAINELHNELEDLISDIHSVNNTLSLDPDSILQNPSYRNRLKHFAEGYNLSSGRYLYISILDNDGNEIARIDNNGSTPTSSIANHLGTIDYSMEYYIVRSLDKGSFFISQPSLARKDAITIYPLQPIMKIAVPIFDNDNHRKGILVFTHYFDRFASLLQRFFPSNRDVLLLNESNQVLIDLSTPNSWEHLSGNQYFKYLPLDNERLDSHSFYTKEEQTNILSAGLFPKNSKHSTNSVNPQWRLAVNSPYPNIVITPWNLTAILALLALSFLFAKLISRTVLSNIANKTQISELLNEVGYQKQALDEHAIVSITNKRGDITYVNDKFSEISGYSKAELIGQNHRILKSDEHSSEFYRQLWHTIANGQVWSGDIKNLRKDGSIYWVHATILPIKGTSGKVERYIAVRTDITESRIISGILEEALKEAHQAAEAKNRFLANISHEIRTPMNAIIGLTEACLTAPNKKNQQELIQKVNNSANNLLRIINDILDFSKMEAGRMEVEDIPFSLEQVLKEHAYVHQSVAKAKHIHLLAGIDSNVPVQLIGDPLRIGQVISNLVSNALKFTSAGEVIVYIRLLRTKGEYVELEFSVQDTGTGMTDEQLNKLFSPFSQADVSTTRQYGGTGLGLSICKSLVSLMGGHIHVDSKYGEGSTFRFNVPLKVDQNKVDTLPSQMQATLEKGRILLIDFIGINRQNYLRYSDALLMHLDVASTSYDTKEKLSTELAYDYIIVDCYKIPPELEDILSNLDQYSGGRFVKTVIVVDHDEELHNVTQWHASTVLLTPPISQSALLDSMTLFQNTATKEEDKEALPDRVESEFSHLNALLVEDNEVNQLVISEIFKSWEIDFEIAENGRDAIKKIQQKPFDLVLMDIQMPIMDGYEASKGIRALGGHYQDLPIIAVTANTDTRDVQRALKAGMNDHVSKPISRQQLQDVIRQQTQPNFTSDQMETTTQQPLKQCAALQHIIDAIPTIDVAAALKRLSVEPAFYLQLLTSFKESSERHLNNAQEMMTALDYEGLEQAFHSIKGIAGNVGATSIYEQAKFLEQAARQHDIPKHAFEQMQQELQTTCMAIGSMTTKPPSLESDVTTELQHSLTLTDCKALLALIDEFDTKANTCIRQLLIEQENTNIYSELNKVENQLSNYNFEEAADILRKLMSSLT